MIGPQRCALLLAGLAVFTVDAGSRHGDLRLSERVRQRALAMPAPAADDRRADVFVRTRFTRCEAWCSWRGFLSNAPTLQRWNQRSAPRRPRQPSSNQSRDFARVDSRALHHRQLVHIHQQPLQKWAFLDRFLAGLHDATLCRLSRKAERSGRLQRMLESPSRRLNRCTFGFASDKPAACYGNALPHNGKLTVPSLQLRAFKIKTEIRKYEDSSRSSRRSIRESISWDRSVE
jgi:hypothetical protein